MTLIVIFGAGASYDCAQEESQWSSEPTDIAPWPNVTCVEGRPPLTSELFGKGRLVQELVSRYPQCAHVVHEARERVRQGDKTLALEHFLREIRLRDNEEDKRALLATRFFLRDYLWACSDYTDSARGPGPASNYSGLLGRLNTWARDSNENIAVVSFNYDLLVDRAFERLFNRKLDRISAYTATAQRLLIKPHGSVNWARRVYFARGFVRVTAQNLVDAGQEVLRRKNVFEDDSDEPYVWDSFITSGNQTLDKVAPVMALPESEKPGPVCPASHLTALRKSLRDEIRILTVGWRGADAWLFEHLREMAAGLRSRAMVVTGGEPHCADAEAKLVGDQLSDVGNMTSDCIVRTAGFRGLTLSDELTAFLSH